MSAAFDWWSRIAGNFTEDDGSLPGIGINNLSPAGVSAIYRMLRARSLVVGDSNVFWSLVEAMDKPVDSVPDPAIQVATRQAEAFHVLLASITVRGVVLPDIGVFIWPDAVELDYRMGPAWGMAQVVGFFELLKECCALDPAAVVEPEPGEGVPEPEQFRRAWTEYQRFLA